MNKGKQEKVKTTKEEYKIKDIFSERTELNVNEIIKKVFLTNLKISELD